MKTSVALTGIASMALLVGVLTGTSVETNGAIEIGVTGRANANASIASAGSFVGIAWAARTKEGVTDIFAVVSRDAGRSFGSPVRVNQAAGEASVSGEQPPRIALTAARGAQPSIVVLWTAKSPSGTRVLSARSTDGGRSFGPARSVPGSDANGNRGWESLTMSAKGDPVAVWLDHREVPARPAGAGTGSAHVHGAMPAQADGAARAQLSQIFFARLNDATSARAIAPGVCYCCKTSIAAGADGSIVAAWRHVYPGNIRDIALAKSSDGGRTFSAPIRVSEDEWELNACPENGPAVAVDHTNAIHVVWPTLVRAADGTEGLALFYAMSRDGRRFTKRQGVPTNGVPRHPQIAVGAAGEIVIVWDEQLKGARRVVMATATVADGAARFTRRALTDDVGTYPAITTVADGALMVWTSGSPEDSVLRVARQALK